MPMGPFELLDEIGLDVRRPRAQITRRSRSDGRVPSRRSLEQAHGARLARQEERQRFYVHEEAKKRQEGRAEGERGAGGDAHGKPRAAAMFRQTPQRDEMRSRSPWRLVLPMVNEAARLLEEGVIDSTDAIDLATVLGTGLAPFRGGLAHFADTTGIGIRRAGLERSGPSTAPASRRAAAARAGGGASHGRFREAASDRWKAGQSGRAELCVARCVARVFEAYRAAARALRSAVVPALHERHRMSFERSENPALTKARTSLAQHDTTRYGTGDLNARPSNARIRSRWRRPRTCWRTRRRSWGS